MWYYAINGQRHGPINEDTLLGMANSGKIRGDVPVWTQGMTAWVSLNQTTLASRLRVPPPTPAPARPLPIHHPVAYRNQKDRTAYVLLAVLLGLGIHNFYAGYTFRGLVQLLAVLFSCLWLWIVVWIWCIIEALTVTEDADGVPFR